MKLLLSAAVLCAISLQPATAGTNIVGKAIDTSNIGKSEISTNAASQDLTISSKIVRRGVIVKNVAAGNVQAVSGK
jgi:hypothetical protein